VRPRLAFVVLIVRGKKSVVGRRGARVGPRSRLRASSARSATVCACIKVLPDRKWAIVRAGRGKSPCIASRAQQTFLHYVAYRLSFEARRGPGPRPVTETKRKNRKLVEWASNHEERMNSF
jgi:hypothetical protein